MGKGKPEDKVTEFLLNQDSDLYRLAYSYTKNREDALDVVQETVIKAIQAARAAESVEKVKPWVCRILINTSLDWIRRRNRALPFWEVPEKINENAAEDITTDFDLERAIDNLPPEYKTIVLLRYFEDMKLEEITVVTGWNISTVKSRLYRAVKLLRLELDEEE